MFWKNTRKIRKKEEHYCDMMIIEKELKKFVSDCQTPFIICCDLDKRKILRLLTNRPGLLIGKQGQDLKLLKETLIKKGVSIKKIRVYEAKHMITNNLVVAYHISCIKEAIK